VALAGATCGPADLPARPSWDQDVFPVLQGSCNHCHGATVGVGGLMPFSRLDLCNLADFQARGFGKRYAFGVAYLFAGSTLGGNLRYFVRPGENGAAPRMPPPPAAPLGDYEVRVLETWVGYGAPDCRKQTRNHPPTARVVVAPRLLEGKLTVDVEVEDPDGDQVLGKLTAGGVEKDLPGTGRHSLDVTGASATDPVSFQLYDGYEAASL
jgi:hypothetical protein